MGAQDRGQVGGRGHALVGEVGELLVVGLLQELSAQGGVGRALQEGGQRVGEGLLAPLFTTVVDAVEGAGGRAQRLDHRGQRLVRQPLGDGELLPQRIRPSVHHVRLHPVATPCDRLIAARFEVTVRGGGLPSAGTV